MGFKEFKEKLISDKAFAEKAKGIKGLEELVEFAKKEGYTFTVDDVKNNSELSDSELESAAGGAVVSIILPSIPSLIPHIIIGL